MSNITPDLGPWIGYNPTWGAGVTVGNASFGAYYKRIGKTVFVRIKFTLGTTSAITGLISFSRPPGLSIRADGGARATPQGWARFYDLSLTATFEGLVSNIPANVTDVVLASLGVSGAAVVPIDTSSTSPLPWTTGDEFYAQFMYEAA